MSLLNRRDAIAVTGAALAASLVGPRPSTSAQLGAAAMSEFGYCFNTSTIRGQKLTVPEQIDVAAKAGYTGIEPWIRDIREYLEAGGSAQDLRKMLADRGLSVESAIGFANWIVDDDSARAAGMEVAKADMELLRSIGGKRIAAPPAGAQQVSGLNLFRAAERYRALLELGQQMEVIPQVELWGHSKSLNRLGELLFVASEAGHPAACLLPDVYHIYKGGSDFEGLRLVHGSSIHVFHMNDYPATPPRESITDADRVFPGDGVAPLNFILRTLHANGFRGMLSLELFNRDYWQRDPLEVAKTGLQKMQAAVQAALG